MQRPGLQAVYSQERLEFKYWLGYFDTLKRVAEFRVIPSRSSPATGIFSQIRYANKIFNAPGSYRPPVKECRIWISSKWLSGKCMSASPHTQNLCDLKQWHTSTQWRRCWNDSHCHVITSSQSLLLHAVFLDGQRRQEHQLSLADVTVTVRLNSRNVISLLPDLERSFQPVYAREVKSQIQSIGVRHTSLP